MTELLAASGAMKMAAIESSACHYKKMNAPYPPLAGVGTAALKTV